MRPAFLAIALGSLLVATLLLAALASAAGPYTVKISKALDQRNTIVPAGATCVLLQIVQFPEEVYKVLCLGLSPTTVDGSTQASVFDVLPQDVSVAATPAVSP